MGVTRSDDQMWYRARRLADNDNYPFENLHQLIYPTLPAKSYGRAHVPNDRVLYGAWNMDTAFAEINPSVGERLQLISFRPRVGVQYPCHIVGEIDAFDRTGNTPFGSQLNIPGLTIMRRRDFVRYQSMQYIDSVITKIFRRSVEIHEKELYRISAVYSQLMHKGNVGVIYPSVKNANAVNLALDANEFDQNFEVIHTGIAEVIAEPGGIKEWWKGGVGCCNFGMDGTINWTARFDRQFDIDKYGGLRENRGRPGWRKPTLLQLLAHPSTDIRNWPNGHHQIPTGGATDVDFGQP